VIASYESELLERFSLCILQKHNCLRNNADIPMVPDPAPMATFLGQKMTHALAEDLFIGHLADSQPDRKPFSWQVACGKNAGTSLQPMLSILYVICHNVCEGLVPLHLCWPACLAGRLTLTCSCRVEHCLPATDAALCSL
jgi:hypothetical protein